ncbi:phosphotransferase enzyme family protein [Kribbella catacumbae]|uniref:phosphotransferase enzyme family protein n=1 Tax=Kribbella catacumbae TaxID=460086 RepID=UPI00037F62F9|nr:phosphotransferase [Kribbella catacumbae]
MRVEPAEIPCDLVTRILSEHWGFRATKVAYAPIGFGSHHWIASEAGSARWFVTADRLDPWGSGLGSTAEQVKGAIEAAAHTAKELAEGCYEFVVAPLPDRTGRLVSEVLPGWTLVVLPYLQGWSTPDGAWDNPAERAEIAGILGRLHTATPPEALQRWDFAVPGRDALLAALADLDQPWSSGPYSEATRLRLAGALDHLRARLAHYDALVREIEASDDPWVVTHGEPNSANVLRTTDGRMRLIDWDSVLLAPRERDLAAVLGGPTPG